MRFTSNELRNWISFQTANNLISKMRWGGGILFQNGWSPAFYPLVRLQTVGTCPCKWHHPTFPQYRTKFEQMIDKAWHIFSWGFSSLQTPTSWRCTFADEWSATSLECKMVFNNPSFTSALLSAFTCAVGLITDSNCKLYVWGLVACATVCPLRISIYVPNSWPASWRIKDQLDVTCSFISLLMCSTCFGH